MSQRSTKEIAKYWSPAGIDGIECLHGNYFSFSFAPHFHSDYAIGVVERGANVFDCGNKTETASLGDVVLLNPEQVHTGHALDESTGMSIRMLFVDPYVLGNVRRSMHEASTQSPLFAAAVVHDEAAAARLAALHRAFESSGSVLKQECLLLSAMAHLLMRHSGSTASDHAIGNENASVRRVCDYIAENAFETIKLDDLAAVAHLSPFHLLRVFHKATGLPPHAYQTQVRIHRAKRLLRQRSSITQVALATGFFDQAHFSRQFKRYVGITPGQFVARL